MISRIQDWPVPKKLENIEAIQKYLRKLYSALEEDSVLRIEDMQSNFTQDIVYTSQGLVDISHDMIMPFYLPSNTNVIEAAYLNIYFPGLQTDDYPNNVSTEYIPHYYSTSKTMRYKDGVADNGFWVPYRLSGCGVDGTYYYWYRWYFKFDLSPYQGFDLSSCDLYWCLDNIATAGAGANTQIALDLEGLNDYGHLTVANWSDTAEATYASANVYNDTLNEAYSKDVSTWVSGQLETDSVTQICFRMKNNSEPTDTVNAIQYYTSNHQLKVILAEDTSAGVDLYVDDGPGFGTSKGTYTSDEEDIDVSSHFSINASYPKKQIKLTGSKARRVNMLLRLRLNMASGTAA